MTVTATNRKNIFETNGVTVEFPFTFAVSDIHQVKALTRDAAGVESDYTNFGVVLNRSSAGGTLTTNTTLNDVELVVYRKTALTQETDYIPGGRFPAESHEAALDKLTLQNQEQQEEIDRALKVSISTEVPYSLSDELFNDELLIMKDNVIQSSGTTIDELNDSIDSANDAAEAAREAASNANGVHKGNYSVGVVYKNYNEYYTYDNGGTIQQWSVKDTVPLDYVTTQANPNNDPNLTLRGDASQSYVQAQDTKSQEELLPTGSQIFPEVGVLENGQTVTARTTHLRVEIGGSKVVVGVIPMIYGGAMPSGSVDSIDTSSIPYSVTIGGSGYWLGDIRELAMPYKYLPITALYADREGVLDSTASILACLKTKRPTLIPEGNFLVSHPEEVSPGDESMFKFDDATSDIFVGMGESSVLKVDPSNTVPCNIVGLSQTFGGEKNLTIGNFKIDGGTWIDDNPGQPTIFTGIRGLSLQSGESVSATYKVNLLTTWIDNCTEGAYIGVDYCTFEDLYITGSVAHGFALANRIGDREAFTYGKSVFCKTNRQTTHGAYGVDLSGGMSANNGVHTATIKNIYIDGHFNGMKIAGDFEFDSDSIVITNTFATIAAFSTNVDFRSFRIGKMIIKDNNSHAFQCSNSGKLTIGTLITSGNTRQEPIAQNGELSFGANSDVCIDDARLEAGGHPYRIIYSEPTAKRFKIKRLRAENFGSNASYPIEMQATESAIIRDFIYNDTWTTPYLVRAEVPYSELEIKITQPNSSNFLFCNSLTNKETRVINSDLGNCTGLMFSDSDSNSVIMSGCTGYELTVAPAEFTDITKGVNTRNKWSGRQIWDGTKYVVATGSLASSVWNDLSGNLAYTPA